jgi:hypothetical protein
MKSYTTPSAMLLVVKTERLICASSNYETETFVENEEVFTW